MRVGLASLLRTVPLLMSTTERGAYNSAVVWDVDGTLVESTDLGFEAQSAASAREVGEYVVASLDQRKAELSGVNVDEELVEMMRFEQSFAAASRYIQVINGLNDTLLALI